MRLLLDENMATSLEAELSACGHPTDHVQGWQLQGGADGVILAFAVAHGYDAVVTKDRYRKGDARLAALRAMRDGLRIIQLRFRQDVPDADSAEAQLRLILDHEREIERAVAPDSPIRQLLLNHAVGGVTRVVTADEVVAELRRLEQRSADGGDRSGVFT